jgi:uridine kinase
MSLCKSKLLSVILARDLSIGKDKETVINRYNDKILPDTLKWVYTYIYNEYIKVIHGNFNRIK